MRKLSNERNKEIPKSKKEKHLWQRCKIQYLASLTWGVKAEGGRGLTFQPRHQGAS